MKVMKIVHFVRTTGGGPPRGYFTEGDRWIPIRVRSVTQGRHMIGMNNMRRLHDQGLERLEREMRRAGLPEVFISVKKDIIEIEKGVTDYWTMMLDGALRVITREATERLVALRLLSYNKR